MLQNSVLDDAIAYVQKTWPHVVNVRVGLVLGSGLAPLADALVAAKSIPYAQIPGMTAPSVPGHPGTLVCGELAGVPVIAMQGRIHAYEGHPLAQVVLGVRLMVRLGARILVVTNAAGGIDPALTPGSLLVIRDHLNLTGQNCLVGANDPALGPRFLDLTAAYDADLRALAHRVAQAQGTLLHEGVYAGVLGPSYETPAEVRMLGVLGASVVGMSTVHEVIAARHMGCAVLGLSCITNPAAGLSPTPLDHQDVEETARRSAHTLANLVCGVLAQLDHA